MISSIVGSIEIIIWSAIRSQDRFLFSIYSIMVDLSPEFRLITGRDFDSVGNAYSLSLQKAGHQKNKTNKKAIFQIHHKVSKGKVRKALLNGIFTLLLLILTCLYSNIAASCFQKDIILNSASHGNVIILLSIVNSIQHDFTAPQFPFRFAKTKPAWNQKPGKY